jgi:hypothetical protein
MPYFMPSSYPRSSLDMMDLMAQRNSFLGIETGEVSSFEYDDDDALSKSQRFVTKFHLRSASGNTALRPVASPVSRPKRDRRSFGQACKKLFKLSKGGTL